MAMVCEHGVARGNPCAYCDAEWLCGGCGEPVEQVGAGWRHVLVGSCPYPFGDQADRT